MDEKKFQEFLKKAEVVQNQSGTSKDGADISVTEDLSIVVMNLISLEEHFFFTGEKTKKDNYFDLAGEVRDVRKKLMKKLVGEPEGEVWCATKHLLAGTIRSIEVGNKLLSEGKKVEAKEMFDLAYKMYMIFWALKNNPAEIKNFKKGSGARPLTMESVLAKIGNCCDE